MSEIKLSAGDRIRVKFDFSDMDLDVDHPPTRYEPGGGYPIINDVRETNFIWIVSRVEASRILCSPIHMPGASSYVVYQNEVLPFYEERRRVI